MPGNKVRCTIVLSLEQRVQVLLYLHADLQADLPRNSPAAFNSVCKLRASKFGALQTPGRREEKLDQNGDQIKHAEHTDAAACHCSVSHG